MSRRAERDDIALERRWIGWRRQLCAAADKHGMLICIDQKPAHEVGLVWSHIPNGAEDETGDRPLARFPLERFER